MPSFTKTFHSKPYESISPSRLELKATGKNVLITGAGSGISKATALAFAEAGASTIVVCGRRIEPLMETKHEIEASHSNANVVVKPLDVSSEEFVKEVFQSLDEADCRIDILVNGAGHLSEGASVKESTLANFWDSFEVQVKGTFLTAQQWLRHIGTNNPTYISFNSLLAHMPANLITTCPASYASSKCAQAKLIEWLAKENAGQARFYSIHPGIVQTKMSMRSLEMIGNPEEMKAKLPWDHVNLPAHFCTWLASSEGTCIPSGKYLWINWDVDELKAQAQEIASDPFSLTMTLSKFPFAEPEVTDVKSNLDLS